MTMTNAWKVAIVLALVLGGVAVIWGHSGMNGNSSAQYGSTVDPNPEWFTAGYKFGKLNSLYLSDSMTMNNGTDQVVWQNNTGAAVTVYAVDVYANGTSQFSTASSTFTVAVGATSTPVLPEPYTLNWEVASSTNDFPDLAITNVTIATGTPAGTYTGSGSGLLYSLVADNFVYHATSTAAVDGSSILVPSGAYLYGKLDSVCKVEGGCETATSTARGFTTLSIPFRYYYSSSN